MITDQPNTGDGDIRQGGGRNAPSTPAPAAPVPAVKRGPLLRMVHHAQTMGLTVEEALEGTGVTLKQFKQIAAWGGAKNPIKQVAAWGGAENLSVLGRHKESR